MEKKREEGKGNFTALEQILPHHESVLVCVTDWATGVDVRGISSSGGLGESADEFFQSLPWTWIDNPNHYVIHPAPRRSKVRDPAVLRLRGYPSDGGGP